MKTLIIIAVSMSIVTFIGSSIKKVVTPKPKPNMHFSFPLVHITSLNEWKTGSDSGQKPSSAVV